MLKPRKLREVDEVDDFFETLLRSGPFPDSDDKQEAICNAVLAVINDYKANGDDIDAELMEPELRTALIAKVYGGRDPANVPYRHIRHALDNPVTVDVVWTKDGWITTGTPATIPIPVREGINGPLKAIRAKCAWCMCGDMAAVRSCPTINCFAWPFRMGNNPFYGRLRNSTGEEDGFEGEAEAAAAQAEFEAEERERLNREVQ